MACLFLHICLVAFFSFDFSGAASNSGVPGSDTSTPSPEHFYSHPSLFDAYVDLQDNILNRTVVRKKVPAIISNYTTKTYLFFEPYQILSVDDEEQTVSMKTTLDLFWLDQNLMWEPGDYLGLDSLQVASSQVWTPRIGMAEDVENDEFKMPASVLIYSNGEVYVFLPGRVKFLCFLDMEFFPFDEHECKLSFLADSWNLHNYLGDEYDLTKHFAASSEWTLLSFDCIDSENPVASAQIVICSIRMRRRSTFYVINIVVPMLLTSVMTLVVFLLPAESGEKMSFLVSLYVSTSVFLNFMVDFLPRSMDKVSCQNVWGNV
ncbi:neuronal acetylcholine receptor subunit beta-3-like [Aplysia californica]|uniref:Neuronal acetylcholine receptor subunit beta-3-like n=1 Tax=Aplysia californica TaxID=6500 RepID=A0ABM1ABV0_APLCA|nr:neuronal acetylcholine receptor subunit beta-3-like [Aplysia californica]